LASSFQFRREDLDSEVAHTLISALNAELKRMQKALSPSSQATKEPGAR